MLLVCCLGHARRGGTLTYVDKPFESRVVWIEVCGAQSFEGFRPEPFGSQISGRLGADGRIGAVVFGVSAYSAEG